MSRPTKASRASFVQFHENSRRDPPVNYRAAPPRHQLQFFIEIFIQIRRIVAGRQMALASHCVVLRGPSSGDVVKPPKIDVAATDASIAFESKAAKSATAVVHSNTQRLTSVPQRTLDVTAPLHRLPMSSLQHGTEWRYANEQPNEKNLTNSFKRAVSFRNSRAVSR